jgi:hypothetical protein
LGTSQGSALVQSYVDRTSDVQTAALLMAHLPLPNVQPTAGPAAAAAAASEKPRVSGASGQPFIHAYRCLLDAWKLWHVRAKFDTQRAIVTSAWGAQGLAVGMASGSFVPARLASSAQVAPQIAARCQYCSTSLSLPKLMDPTTATSTAKRVGQGPGLGAARGLGLGATSISRMGGLGLAGAASSDANTSGGSSARTIKSTRLTACPTCRKPLPHCALCLLPLTCAPPTVSSSGSGLQGPIAGADRLIENATNLDRKSSFRFEQWISWCQACRHGGHAVHMAEVPICCCDRGHFAIDLYVYIYIYILYL